MPDAASEAAEERELRAALDRWLAAQDRRFEVRTDWISSETSTFLFHRSQGCRVVLHARLVPVAPR